MNITPKHAPESDLQKQTILIIDDNPANLGMLSEYLEEYGFEVLVARDGQTGLEKTWCVHPELILLDVVIPGIDGFETCRRLKSHEDTRDIPVMFMTELTETEYKIKGFRMGAVDYITKPFQREEVLARVITHLRLRELNERLERKVREHTSELTAANQQLQQDIIERKRAETALRESDAQLRLLIENSRDMISRHQPDGKVVYVSPACETLLGYSPSEIVEAGAGDFVHPDDIDGVWEAIQAALEGGYDTYRVEHRMRCKSGDYIWIETIGRLLYTPEGELAEIQCMARDISERKRAENLLRIQRDLALALSSENQMKTVVDKLLEYLLQIEEFDCGGVYLVDEETGALDLIFHTGLTSEFAEQVAHYEADTPQTRYVMTGASLYRSYDEILSETKDSVRRQEGLRVLAVIPVIFEGQVIAVLNLASHTYTDISTNVRNAVETMATSHIGEVLARINAETALQTLNAKLEQRVIQRTAELEALNQDLNSFAYIVSHDLKAPLRNINQLAQWLIEDYAESFDEEGRKMFELLMSTVKQMDRLINGILDYSRVGRKVGETFALDLDILVKEVIDLLGPPPQIHIHIEQPLPTVMGDRVRLEQVFQNLLSNAIKFMDKPDGRISIHCLDEGAYWKFSISDNGPGIEPKYYEKIFQIFHTLHTHDEQENTGIGLAIVKKIIEFYDGRIWVESTLGEGSVFFFTLPKKGE